MTLENTLQTQELDQCWFTVGAPSTTNVQPTFIQTLVSAGPGCWVVLAKKLPEKSTKNMQHRSDRLKQLGRYGSLNHNIHIAADPILVGVDHAAHACHCIVRP